jgi:hypothetical protein
VHEQFQETRFPWPVQGPAWYANRAIDQGIGRAMWFVGGADAAVVTQLLGKFPDHRLADLYSGAGLAATYAGGADEAELRAFWHDAGRFRPLVAQGSAFAAAARLRADLVVAHNELATQVFCGMPVAAAAKVTDDALGNQSLTSRTPTEEVLTDQGPTDTTDRDHGLPDPTRSRAMPAYEVWRQRIANEFVALGRC